MSIKQGVQNWVDNALETNAETVIDLVDGGMDYKNALLAAKILTKKVVAERLDAHFDNRSASEITHTISQQQVGQLLN